MTDKMEPLEEARARLTLAKTYGHFLLEAYDALLHHGVNFKSLPEWQRDPGKLEEIRRLPTHRYVQEYISWMGRVSNAIKAAIRRKAFRVVVEEDPK